MRTFIALLAAFAVTVSLSCNRTAPESSGTPKIAMVVKTLNHPFFVDMRRGAQEAADRLGVRLEVQAAEREIDVEKQMQIVENMLQTGIQALIIAPSGSREIVSALVKARDARIPVVIVDTRIDEPAATVIGGTSLIGGEGSLTGTLIGALIMGVLRNGLNLLGVSSFLQQIVIGAVIIAAVLIDTVLKKQRN